MGRASADPGTGKREFSRRGKQGAADEAATMKTEWFS